MSIESTTPKPFIFILMPIKKEFDNIYKIGIKDAAKNANAYAERVDEQMYTEGILERIFNQISKADVIIADMSQRNPNVFYEVGYAHALGKIVLLLTQNADDIPFDLKHRPHTIYDPNNLDTLRTELTKKISWAISEAAKQSDSILMEQFFISICGQEILEKSVSANPPIIEQEISENSFTLPINIFNNSFDISTIYYSYIYAAANSDLILYETKTADIPFSANRYHSVNFNDPLTPLDIPKNAHPDDGLNKQYSIENSHLSIPPQAVEQIIINLMVKEENTTEASSLFKLRIYSKSGLHDYPFIIKVKLKKEKDKKKA